MFSNIPKYTSSPLANLHSTVPCKHLLIFLAENLVFLADWALNRAKLMIASGLTDFSLKDIYKPETPRLITIFSALINLAKYREQKLEAFDAYVQSTVSLGCIS